MKISNLIKKAMLSYDWEKYFIKNARVSHNIEWIVENQTIDDKYPEDSFYVIEGSVKLKTKIPLESIINDKRFLVDNDLDVDQNFKKEVIEFFKKPLENEINEIDKISDKFFTPGEYEPRPSGNIDFDIDDYKLVIKKTNVRIISNYLHIVYEFFWK